jgi:hypothetical protein
VLQREREREMRGLGVTAVMVTTQFVEVGMNTILKAAMSRGMSNFVFVVYSNALAIFVLLAASIIFYRFTYSSAPTLLTQQLLCTAQYCSNFNIFFYFDLQKKKSSSSNFFSFV